MCKWKKNELKMHESMCSFKSEWSNLRMNEYGYSRFDAFNDEYVVEYKYRKVKGDTEYDSLMLEKEKCKEVISAAFQSNRTALYVCQMGKKVYVFNLSTLYSDKYFNSELNPGVWSDGDFVKTTAFSNNNMVNKPHTMLPNDIAEFVFDA